jgi:hypothetical protein
MTSYRIEIEFFKFSFADYPVGSVEQQRLGDWREKDV